MENVILIAIAMFLVWMWVSGRGIRSMTTAELKKRLNDKDKVFIDVRTREEFNAKNIPPFKNMPLGSDYSTLPKDKEIVVICQSGFRSKLVCKQLKKLGYERVTNVRGGMNAWK